MEILSDEKISQIREIASKNPQIIAGYLFGSYQTGKQRSKSDIDLGFLCFDKTGLAIPSFSLSISKLFLPKDADVNTFDIEEKPLILIEIINGMVIYQKSIDERILLEKRVLKFYEDYLHLQSIKNYYLNKSFAQGLYAGK